MEHFECPVRLTADLIGGKWKPLILFYLESGTRRFSEIQRLIPGTNKKMLTKHLRELERDEIIHREVYAEVPPRVGEETSRAARRRSRLSAPRFSRANWSPRDHQLHSALLRAGITSCSAFR